MPKEKLKKNDIQIGIVFKSITDEGTHKVKNVCSCGNISEAEYLRPQDIPNHHECNNCGNKSFLPEGKIPKDKRVARPTFFNVKTSYRGFEASKTNLSFIYKSKEDKFEILKPNMVRTIVFDWVDKKLRVYKDGKIEVTEKSNLGSDEVKRAHNYLMRGISYDDFFEEIDVPNKEFYNYIKISEIKSNSWYGTTSVSDKRVIYSLISAIDNYESYNCIQILSNAGYKNLKIAYSVGWVEAGTGVYTGTLNLNTAETKPHKILGVSKKVSKYIKNTTWNSRRDFNDLKNLLKDKEKRNDLLPILEIIDDNYDLSDMVTHLEDLITMKFFYNYDISRLLEYLQEDIAMTQGITRMEEGLTLLKDYLDMCSKMNIGFEKYPKSLKKIHDVVTVNHREFQRAQKTESFEEIMKGHQYLKDNSRKYSIVLPETSKDLVVEGGKLNHCVGSYVSRVSKGDAVIAFMRKSNNIEEPHVTVEIKDNRVRQARGRFNRGLEEDEKEYLKEWAKNKRIYY